MSRTSINLSLVEKTAAPRKRCVTTQPSQVQILREAFKKADSKCESCGSTYALEVDHIFPKAKGGTSDADNLRILCRSCNQRSAIKEFGIKKMDQYLN